MRKFKVILILGLTLTLIGCTINKNYKVKEKVQSIDTQIESEVNIDSNKNLRNIACNKKQVEIIKSNSNTQNVEDRNKDISEEYIRAIGIVKEFSRNNSLEIKYIQPISDRISSLKEFPDDVNCILLKNLENLGAETIHYFTDEENLNIDLSINTTEAFDSIDDGFISFGETYSSIEYKASIENINDKFNFKDSKLNEFRNLIVKDESLDYEKLNDYIKKIYSQEYDSNTVFLNKIDNNKYEVIRVENNNCYYRLVYDPIF